VLNLEELVYGIHSIWRVSTLETYRYTMSTLLSSSFDFLCFFKGVYQNSWQKCNPNSRQHLNADDECYF
jgi:hypothetical protein